MKKLSIPLIVVILSSFFLFQSVFAVVWEVVNKDPHILEEYTYWGKSSWGINKNEWEWDGSSIVRMKVWTNGEWNGGGLFQGSKPFGWGDAPYVFDPIEIDEDATDVDVVKIDWRGMIDYGHHYNILGQANLGVNLWFDTYNPDGGWRIAEMYIFFYQYGIYSIPLGWYRFQYRSEEPGSWLFMSYHYKQMADDTYYNFDDININNQIDYFKRNSRDPYYRGATFYLRQIDSHLEVTNAEAQYYLDYLYLWESVATSSECIAVDGECIDREVCNLSPDKNCLGQYGCPEFDCCCSGTCDGDIDRDGNVDFDDLYYVLIAYGAKEGDPNYDPDADLDNDGYVDLDDLYCVLVNYGTGEEPSLLEEASFCQTLSDMVVSSYGKKCGDSGYDKVADVNKDSIIDMTDLTFLVIDNYQDEAWCEDRLNDYFDPCLTTTTIRRRRGGRGCPILKVYDGKEFVTVEKLDIHSPKDQDVTYTSTFTMKPINGKYEIILDEVAYLFWDGSHIDHVSLIDEKGKECQLISATHSKQGDVLQDLQESDDIRTRTFPGEEIKLVYDECSGKEFTFSIEGYNKKMLGFEIPNFVVIMLAMIILFVIFGVLKFFVKK